MKEYSLRNLLKMTIITNIQDICKNITNYHIINLKNELFTNLILIILSIFIFIFVIKELGEKVKLIINEDFSEKYSITFRYLSIILLIIMEVFILYSYKIVMDNTAPNLCFFLLFYSLIVVEGIIIITFSIMILIIYLIDLPFVIKVYIFKLFFK